MSVTTSIIRSLASAFHKIAGAALFRIHLYERSLRHFEQVLEIKGDDFMSYVYLGRIAYNLGDRAGWRRECEHAQRTSPPRYAKLKHPFELFGPRADDNISAEAGARATWRDIEVSSVSRSFECRARDDQGLDDPCSESQILPATGLGPRPGNHRDHSGDDFCSEEERRRFQSFNAIDPAELHQCDLDELIRQLTA